MFFTHDNDKPVVMVRHPTQNDLQKPQGSSLAVSLDSGLYLVATPIGNLRDISLRALDVLGAADLIVCEDTRVSGKLFKAYDIDTKMMTYNDHSDDRQRLDIIKKLQTGQVVAVVSDAGTPLISDPGYKLVRDVIETGLKVFPIPGASAALSGLQLSGLPSDQFCFLGFLPAKQVARLALLRQWQVVQATLIAYESAARLIKALVDIETVMGDRSVAVTREMTKLHEEARRGSATELLAYYQEHGAPKGEIVLVIEGAKEGVSSKEALEVMLKEALKILSVRDAAESVAKASGQSKKEVYAMALELAKNNVL